MHRVRIKCSNAFYGTKNIVCNRAAHLLVHTSLHTDSEELFDRLVGCMDRIYLSAFVQTWNYMRTVRRKCAGIPASPSFSRYVSR